MRSLLASRWFTLDLLSANSLGGSTHRLEYWIWRGNDARLKACRAPAAAPLAELLRLRLKPEGLDAEKEVTSSRTSSTSSGVPVGTSLLLSDASVNIWEFRLRPSECCAFHVHMLPYCFVNFTSNLTQALDCTGAAEGRPTWQSAWQARFVGREQLGAHGVRNVGEGEFLQALIEFKAH
eukprot:TRINITY_DN87517_c0_g1_i1.p1 TRINITY_DN87517_c0_g1~~TRINITY_DN87517_c0_g1_i1.p1  ORF type:complete len:193 (-),score=30.76 TRINITY_DN87517_c0_g1_i1:8-544(-)